MEKKVVRFIDEREHETIHLKLTEESIKLLGWLIDEGYIEDAYYIYDEDIRVIEF